MSSRLSRRLQCRRALQWSYAFGFYLEDKTRQKAMFEGDQVGPAVYRIYRAQLMLPGVLVHCAQLMLPEFE
jgi:hypothetical protein